MVAFILTLRLVSVIPLVVLVKLDEVGTVRWIRINDHDRKIKFCLVCIKLVDFGTVSSIFMAKEVKLTSKVLFTESFVS